MSYPGTPQQAWPTAPPFQRKIRKVGAPLAVLILLGAIVALMVIGLTALNPVGASIGILLTSITTTVVLLAYIWLDRWEPEPPRLLAFAFLWGASVSIIIATILGLFLESLISSGDTGTSPLSTAIGAPVIEEAAKGAFLLLMMTGRRRNELNSLTDCLVYAGLVGAGFSWLEDILYIAGGASPGESIDTAAARLIMGPFAHSLFTTFFGIGVHFALQQRSTFTKLACITAGYLGAVLMHGLWNGSSLLGGETYLLVYAVWMVPVFLAVIAIGVSSRRREQKVVATKLPGMVSAGLVTPNEATWLGSLRDRKQAIAAAGHSGGKAGAKAVKNFAAQVVELAFVRDRIDRGFGDERVHALQQEEVNGVAAARAGAPLLQWMANYRAPGSRPQSG